MVNPKSSIKEKTEKPDVDKEENEEIENTMEESEIAHKTKMPKVDKEETERLRKFNEELRGRKAPIPKAK
jgi:hypothetical protein